MMEPKSRILITEDEPGTRAALAALLEAPGYDLAFAADGPETLRKAAAMTPDLILLDVMLPGLNGFEVCRRLRADPVLAEVPIIMITVLDDRASRLEGFECGADDFINKPFDRGELRARVATVTRLNRYRQLVTERSKFDRLFELAPDGVLIVDAAGLIQMANPAVLRLLRAESLESVLARDVLTLVGPEQRADCATWLNPVLAGSSTEARAESVFVLLDGSFCPVEVSAGHLNGDHQQAAQLIVRDVSARKHAEERLREQAALLDKATDAIVVHDTDSRITFWNRGAERLYGWTAAEAIGHDAAEFLFPDHALKVEEAARAVEQSGEWVGELHQVTKAGKTAIVASRWTLVRDERGRPKATLIINTDITEKKQVEEQALRSQRLESLGTLAGGIAHDLNNVLTPITMALDLLKLNLPESQRRSILTELGTCVGRGAEMVQQILSFARGFAGQRMLLPPKAVIQDVEKMIRRTLPKNIEIQVRMPGDLWTISGDATQLFQSLMNLCVNARDAMADGGLLTVAAANRLMDEGCAGVHAEAKPGHYVVITVTDTGTGIPPETLDKIFYPFFTTKAPGKGTGLGLATTLAIVRSHGGFITIANEPGQGTQFSLFLPAVVSAQSKQSQERSRELPVGHGELILVVDDEAAVRQITRTTLEAYGYRVLLAANGMEAVSLYTKHQGEIRLVVTDLMMPVMDGAATIRALQEINPHVRIITMSGMEPGGNAAKLNARDELPFVPKPYTAEQMLTTLYQTLQGKRTHTVSG